MSERTLVLGIGFGFSCTSFLHLVPSILIFLSQILFKLIQLGFNNVVAIRA
jgi:hypothetical protein